MFMMIIANILGVFLFLYLFWKTLKEDYLYEQIFNLAFLILIGVLIGFITSNFIFKDYWFWMILLGSLLGFSLGVIKQKMKFFESLEGYAIGLLPWIGLFYLTDSIKHSSLSLFLASWAVVLTVFIYFFCKSHYRSFTWYKSGRVGFAGVIALIVFFITRIIFTFGSIEMYFSISATLLLSFLLYNLFKKND